VGHVSQLAQVASMNWIVDTSWASVGRTLGSGFLIYLVVVAAVRVNGLRTFAKMSGYDFAATVAIGSITGAVTITQSVPVLEGIVAVVSIVGSQRLLTEIRRRTGLEVVIDNPPVLLVAHGRILADGMKATGMNESDLNSTLRSSGISSISQVTAVVFEPTGERSVITDPIHELDPHLFEMISGIPPPRPVTS